MNIRTTLAALTLCFASSMAMAADPATPATPATPAAPATSTMPAEPATPATPATPAAKHMHHHRMACKKGFHRSHGKCHKNKMMKPAAEAAEPAKS